ncbi:MAG TPA: tRNA (adenosine(37)-N6)-dimethylallyltransferase MiaA [Gemmatales bacterium]|nr:tRNA (adenosine(37)-N6)-dimethylallyltransferase MiaA [Gemmatales bacterium]
MPDLASFDHALILTGPTASGKSGLALSWAERNNGEIISMDSMALYRTMDIGTAKPSVADQLRIPHHLIDCLDPWERASVAWWLTEASRATRDILQRRKRSIIVGGTPLYLKALLCGLFKGPEINPRLRTELEQEPADVLYERLQPVDPKAAARIHPNDHRRLVRALEVFLQTGKPLTDWQQQFDAAPRSRPSPVICIELPRDELYCRIDARVDAMMQMGWLEEVKRLLKLPQGLSKEATQAAGYRELAEHLHGTCSLEEAVTATKTRSRQLAKRQLTWFRHFPGLVHLSPIEAERHLAATSLP